MSSEATRRKDSQLEADDPDHCKECGGQLPNPNSRDNDGRPLVWTNGQWEPLEKCADCWLEEELEKVVRHCEDRYAGISPGVEIVENTTENKHVLKRLSKKNADAE